MKSLAGTFCELLNKEPQEEDVQRFLVTHPEVLRTWCTGDPEAELRPKVSLHRYVPDFAVGFKRATTMRWVWNLVEIERPDYRLFTGAGNPTSELTHALRQVADWRSWIQNNMAYARTILPDIVPLCEVSVIIGRRGTVEAQEQRDLLEMLELQSHGVRIVTFDSLVDVCERLDRGAHG